MGFISLRLFSKKTNIFYIQTDTRVTYTSCMKLFDYSVNPQMPFYRNKLHAEIYFLIITFTQFLHSFIENTRFIFL